MQVRVSLTKSDIARANVLLLSKSPSSLKGVLIFVVVVGALLFFARSPEAPTDWAILLLAAVLGGVIAFLVSCTISLVWILLNSTDRAGVTGEHVFEITEQGFSERTAQNVSVQAWAGMWKPMRSSKLIVVRINAYLFHVLPLRAFANEAEYEAWWSEISRRCGAA